jgi:Ca2+-binding EF-hand superfamily protein
MKHLDVDCDGQVSRDEIFSALLVDSRHQRSHHFARVNVDHLLKRIKQGAEKFKSLEEFCRYIFVKMDTDGSGTLSFNELSAGLIEMGIEISNKEKHELMKRLDDDADGEIKFEEFYQGLALVKQFQQPNEVNQSHKVNIDHALVKIAKGAEQYKCIEDYIIMLFNKFDINKDGAVSFKELREGLMSMNVHLADNEMHALFHKLDADRDGSITQEELFNAILTKEKYTKNPNIMQSKVSIDHVLRLIRKGVQKYSSLREYVDVLMKKFDVNGDGMIGFDELAEGLKGIDVKISDKEKLALMRELDRDRDGGISK